MKRFLLAFSFLLVLGAILFFSLRPKPLLSDGEFLELFLTKKIRNISDEKATKMKGAIALIERDFEGAKAAFCEAMHEGSFEEQRDLNQLLALTAFLNCHRKDFFCYESAWQQLFSLKNQADPLLIAINAYWSADYKRAAHYFQISLNDLKNEQANSFYHCVASRAYPPQARKIHLAHALIELGQIKCARELLESDPSVLNPNHPYADSICAALALSYLKEIFDHRYIHFHPATYYLEKVEGKIHSILHQSLSFALTEAIENPHTSLQCKSAFITFLEKKGSGDDLLLLADRLAQQLDLAFDGIEKNSPFFELLLEKQKEAALVALRSNSIDLFGRYLALYPQIWDCNLQNGTLCYLYTLCFSDVEKVEEVLHLIAPKNLPFSVFEKLIEQGQILWKSEGKEREATHLFELVCDCAKKTKGEDASCFLLKKIQGYLQELFVAAQRAYLVKRLSIIHEMADRLSIPLVFATSRDKIANTVADAKYFFSSNLFHKAKSHAEWALCCDPDNEEALTILGLSAFQLGDFKLALRHLKRLSTKNEEAREAIFLCQVANDGKTLAQGQDADP